MEGKIDVFGQVYIKRGSQCRGMTCCVGQHRICSDACALFGEPEVTLSEKMYGGEHLKTECISLQLCHRRLVFEKLIDERK
jgi:hypothetical protein